MCVLVLAHHFMIYMSNIELLKDRMTEYLDTLVTGLITRWVTLYRMYQEEVWNNDAQDVDGFEMLRSLNEQKDDLEDGIKPLLKEALTELTSTIEDMRQTRTSVLSRSDICEKFAAMNVAVFECLTKAVNVVDQCEMLKMNEKKGEF